MKLQSVAYASVRSHRVCIECVGIECDKATQRSIIGEGDTMFYVKAWHTETGDVRWMGPFETQHMAGCVAMSWDQGVTLDTATEAVAERFPKLT